MENERNKAGFLTGFLREFATIFTLFILCFSLVGNFVSIFIPDIQNLSTLFALEGAGLSYSTILQAFVFSIIMAFISRFLFSNIIEIKIPYLKRHIIFLFITLIITTIFSILFNWFPVNDIHAWFLFIPFFLVSCLTAIGLSILLMKLEDKKYNKLLENYKNKFKE
ncbi:MAG: hypothetical protein FWD47_12470 [Treponema sp.]|nr:hypothetical protein [Treponema sp.]